MRESSQNRFSDRPDNRFSDKPDNRFSSKAPERKSEPREKVDEGRKNRDREDGGRKDEGREAKSTERKVEGKIQLEDISVIPPPKRFSEVLKEQLELKQSGSSQIPSGQPKDNSQSNPQSYARK